MTRNMKPVTAACILYNSSSCNVNNGCTAELLSVYPTSAGRSLWGYIQTRAYHTFLNRVSYEMKYRSSFVVTNTPNGCWFLLFLLSPVLFLLVKHFLSSSGFWGHFRLPRKQVLLSFRRWMPDFYFHSSFFLRTEKLSAFTSDHSPVKKN